MKRDVQAGDVVQVVGSMAEMPIGTVVDPWLQETHIESVWWNIMLSTGQIIQWPTSQLKVLSPNPTAKKGN